MTKGGWQHKHALARGSLADADTNGKPTVKVEADLYVLTYSVVRSRTFVRDEMLRRSRDDHPSRGRYARERRGVSSCFQSQCY